MLNKYKLFIASAILFSSSAFSIENQITINKSIMHFNNNQNISQSFSVRNGFSNKAYVSTDLYEIVNPGKDNESKILYKAMDFESDKTKEKLIHFKNNNISVLHPVESSIHQNPPRMILDSKGSYLDTKSISIVNINESLKKEKVYRLRVYPVLKGFEKENKVNGIKFLMQYEVLILVQPDSPTLDYTVEYKENTSKIIVSNNGNSNFILEDIEQCDEENKNCYTIPPKRIYADITHTFELKYKTNVSAIMNFGGELKKVVFEPK